MKTRDGSGSVIAEPRPSLALSTGWEFHRGRVTRSWLREPAGGEGARIVDLPHCWNGEDTFEPGSVYYQGWGGYRRTFDFAPPAVSPAPAWVLRTDGFYGRAEFWLNGHRVAAGDGAYLGMAAEVTTRLRAGENRLAVRMENRYHRDALPGIRDPDFLLYGGLAGAVRLEAVPALHFVAADTWVHTPRVEASAAQVVIPFGVCNLGRTSAAVQVEWRIDAAHTTAAPLAADAVTITVPPGAGAAFAGQMQLTLPAPRPWRPEDPALYVATGRLLVDDRVVDDWRVRFGCRTAAFRPDAGFFLNGERVGLRGVNRHEALPGFGNALPDALHRADALQMKRMGLNFVRLSHYPQHPSFLDACDELGLLVYAELASWKSVRTGAWLRAACRQLDGLVRRDRSHPSVIIWGLGNEARSRPAYRRLGAVAAALDPTRPVTYAENHLYRARRKRTLGEVDVWGCNYELDVLPQAVSAARLRTVIVSELANYPPGVRGQPDEEARQLALIEAELERLRALPFVAGFALWCWSDYATMRKTRHARHCGLVDAWRLPKLAAAWIEARFAAHPVLRVWGDWSRGPGRTARRVHVVTNCAGVTLAAGGAARRVLPDGATHHVLDLPWTPEALVVEGGHPAGAARAELHPHGPAARLVLRPDPDLASAEADALAVLRIGVLDADGRAVAAWSGWVDVRVATGGRLVRHTPRDAVPVAAGEGRCFIRRSSPDAPLRVRVDAPDLAGVEFTLASAAGDGQTG